MIHILVEGWTDKEFLEEYLKFLNISEDRYMIHDCQGCTQKDTIKSILTEIEDQEEKAIVIFDADQKSHQSKLKSILGFSTKLHQNDVFLFPNNRDIGEFETLLFKIAREPEIVRCFESYKNCIAKINSKYRDNIKKKSARYAFFDALGYSLFQGSKTRQNDYKTIFNFQSTELDPLKDFLIRHLNPQT